MRSCDVAIIGSRVTGYLTANYLKVEQPDLDVVVVGSSELDAKLPMVGESLTEFSTYFINKIGLSGYLEDEQYRKYSLTFYFKKDLSDPACRTYSVQESPAMVPMPSSLINRWTFDEKLRGLADDRGVERIDARMREIHIDGEGGHRLELANTGGGSSELRCKWVIDCSGRSRLLGRKFGLHEQIPVQRSTFWMRLIDFDRSLIKKLDAKKIEHSNFESYYVAHHFFGDGYWIWCIPMRSPEHEEFMSIGIIYQPDIQTEYVRSPEDFYALLRRDHPVLADMVDSGDVYDQSSYRNYMYRTRQLYSEDRWFIAGDAGYTVDPLYSTGLAMSCLQAMQIEELIRMDRENGELCAETALSLERAFLSFHRFSQDEIGELYKVMHDPYQTAWRIQLAVLGYFHMFLPMWLAGYIKDPAGADLLVRLTEILKPKKASLNRLITKASARLGPDSFKYVVNRYDRMVNWRIHGPDEERLPGFLGRLLMNAGRSRVDVLAQAKWPFAPLEYIRALIDLVVGRSIGWVFGKRSLRRSKLLSFFAPPLPKAEMVAKPVAAPLEAEQAPVKTSEPEPEELPKREVAAA